MQTTERASEKKYMNDSSGEFPRCKTNYHENSIEFEKINSAKTGCVNKY